MTEFQLTKAERQLADPRLTPKAKKALVLSMMAAAFPNFKMTDESAQVYLLALEDVEYNELLEAGIALVNENGRRFFPTVGEIRQAVADGPSRSLASAGPTYDDGTCPECGKKAWWEWVYMDGAVWYCCEDRHTWKMPPGVVRAEVVPLDPEKYFAEWKGNE